MFSPFSRRTQYSQLSTHGAEITDDKDSCKAAFTSTTAARKQSAWQISSRALLIWTLTAALISGLAGYGVAVTASRDCSCSTQMTGVMPKGIKCRNPQCAVEV